MGGQEGRQAARLCNPGTNILRGSTSTEATTGRTSPRAHVRRVDAGIATFRNRFALPVAAMASRSLWS